MLKKILFSEVWELRTPKNITYLWGFGRFLGVIIVIQVFSGLLLACYFVRGTIRWDSVVEITREVSRGWLLRLIHGNSASFVFMVIFAHFLRGLIQRSFYLKGPWLRGVLIILLTIMSAFLGYVLPWGQISFWGATVIINLLRILPKGKFLVIWLWGGFYVSAFTCRFFYAFHFLTPLIVLAVAGVHLILLHLSGRRIPGGLCRSNRLKIKFSHFFRFKDMVNITFLWIIWFTLLAFPDWSADPVNFRSADLTRSPIHIQPEWYFLHLYAILRRIPRKAGGLICFGLALIILGTLRYTSFFLTPRQFARRDFLIWIFIYVNIILIWLGRQPVEAPFIFLGQIRTILYFGLVSLVILLDYSLSIFF